MANETPGPDTQRVGLAVGLCTYQRKPGLKRCLGHIAGALARVDGEKVVIVVDNDGADPAVRELVAASEATTHVRHVFVVETRPGISAARNAVLAEADALAMRFLAMLDDDEWPTEAWVSALVRVAEDTSAAIVGGPVSPVFPSEAADLQPLSRYWSVGPQLLAGKPFVYCTCNFLADLAQLAALKRPLFDETFGLTGGGDTAFFRGLFFAGYAMAWADEAVVYEEIPPSRASLSWIRKRKFRVGNHAVRWETIGQSPRRTFAKTLGLTLRLPVYPLFRREPESWRIGWLLELEKVRGRYAAHFGHSVAEYAREAASSDKPCR